MSRPSGIMSDFNGTVEFDLESVNWETVYKLVIDENAKLRELVADMYACISHANEQDWFYFERDKSGCGMSCTVNGEVCGLCVLAGRMRELGIEV